MALEGDLYAPEGTRFLRGSDGGARFETGGVLAGRVAFGEFVEYHAPGSHKLLLNEYEGHIIAIACCVIRPDDLFIEYRCRNAAFDGPPGIMGGGLLIEAIQPLALTQGRRAVRLDCVSDPRSLAWYASRGFEPEGPWYADADWGLLRPMGKRL